MEYQNLRFLQESLLKTQGIFSWSLTKAGQLLYSNAPDQEYYEKLLHQSTTKEIILSHFSERHVPLIAVDELGLAWIAACQDEKEEETFSLLHLLGPVRSIEMTESYLKQNPSPVLRDDYLSYLRRLPTLLSDVAVRYACLLAASISETTITPDMVEILTPPMPKTEAP
ncbi:MAG: hypothetical protein IIZ39_13395, partial [Blautia sp.]|nr:hypothetical protein [Blautia sp.]